MKKIVAKLVIIGTAMLGFLGANISTADAAVTITSVTVNSASATTAVFGSNNIIKIKVDSTLTPLASWGSTKYIFKNNSAEVSDCRANTTNNFSVVNKIERTQNYEKSNNLNVGSYDVIVKTYPVSIGIQNCQGSENSSHNLLSGLEIKKADHALMFDTATNAITLKTYGDAGFEIGATSNGITQNPTLNSTISYSSKTTDICTISGNTVTIIGTGTCTLAANHAGNENYNIAPEIVKDIVIAKKQLTATATAQDKAYDGTTNALNTVTLNGVVSPDVITATAGANFSDKNVGEMKTVTFSNIVIDGAKKDNYIAPVSIADTKANITKLSITVTADNKTKELGAVDPALTYTTSPALISGDSLVGNLVREVGETIGTYRITQGTLATDLNVPQNYAATYVFNDFLITKKSQTITWTNVPDKNFGEGDFQVSATSSSNLPVVIALDTGFQPCTLLPENMIHITNIGQCRLVISQDGDKDWFAAKPVYAMIEIKDLTAPIITITGANPTYVEVMGVFVDVGATATDNFYSGLPQVTVESYTVNRMSIGEYAVVYKATDNVPRTGYATRRVIVRDTIAPVITPPESQTFEATGVLTMPSLVMATATDAYDTNPVITYSPKTFSIGKNQVTWTAKDSSNNQSTATSEVIIVDTTKPKIETPAMSVITEEATDKLGKVATYTSPKSSDIVDGEKTSTCLPASGSVFKRGETIVTCNQKDTAGNDALPVTFTVKITDTSTPVITLNGAQSVNIPFGSVYKDLGATVSDANEDNLVAVMSGSVNASIAGVYTLSFDVSDTASPTPNKAKTVTRTVTVDAQIVTPASSGGGGGGGGSIPVTVERIKELQSSLPGGSSTITQTNSTQGINKVTGKVIKKKIVANKKKTIAKAKKIKKAPQIVKDKPKTQPVIATDKPVAPVAPNTGTANVIDAVKGILGN